MKKFWEKYKERIIAILLTLFGVGGYATYDQANEPEQVQTLTDQETAQKPVFRVWYVIKQNGTPDTRLIFADVRADKAPTKAAIDKAGSECQKPVFCPAGYEYLEYYGVETIKKGSTLPTTPGEPETDDPPLPEKRKGAEE